MTEGPHTPDPSQPDQPGAGAPGDGGYTPPPPPPPPPSGSTPPPPPPPSGSTPPPPPAPPYGAPQADQPYPQQPAGYPPPAGYPAAGYPNAAPSGYGANPYAPYGVHPVTGVPYSDKTKLVAGLLQILIPLGIGRFYLGDTKTGVWQLVVTLVTCGIGALWPFIDGIIILATDNVTDGEGRPLRMS